LQLPQCLFPSAELLDASGHRVPVKHITKETRMLSSEEDVHSKVKALPVLPATEHDMVSLVYDGGRVEMTHDHHILARSHPCPEFSPVLAGDVRLGAEVWALRESDCVQSPVTITSIEKRRVTTEVVRIEVDPPTAAAFLVGKGGFCVAVFGFRPTPFRVGFHPVRRMLDVKGPDENLKYRARSDPGCNVHLRANTLQKLADLDTVSDPNLASKGSRGHITGDCAGSCKFFNNGCCNLGIACENCHELGCTKQRHRPGSNAKRRHRRNGKEAMAGMAMPNDRSEQKEAKVAPEDCQAQSKDFSVDDDEPDRAGG